MSEMPNANQYRRQNRSASPSDSMDRQDRQTDDRQEQPGEDAGGLGVAIVLGLALLARAFFSK